MNNSPGKPVFAGKVDRVLSERIVDHASPASASADPTVGEEMPRETRRCCEGSVPRLWCFVVVGIISLALLVVAGRYLRRRPRARHSS